MPFEVAPETQHPQIKKQITPEVPNIFPYPNTPCPHDHSDYQPLQNQPIYHKDQIHPLIFPNDH